MAFRDTWHRTLVYFGLAEDDTYEEEIEPYAEPEVELQDTYRERPNVRRLSSRRWWRRDSSTSPSPTGVRAAPSDWPRPLAGVTRQDWPRPLAGVTRQGRFHLMQVGLIGAGNMARALARGWGDPVVCSDGGSGRARELAEELGGEAFDSNVEVARRADVVVLCHKPYQLKHVAREIADQSQAVASVLGGTSIGMLQEAYPRSHVFKLMPNTPVEVRQGVTLYSPSHGNPPI